MARKITDTTPVQDAATASTVKDQTAHALTTRLERVAHLYGSDWSAWCRAVVDVLSTPAVPLRADTLPLSQDGMVVTALEPAGQRGLLECAVTSLDADTPTAVAGQLVAVVLDFRDRLAGPLTP